MSDELKAACLSSFITHTAAFIAPCSGVLQMRKHSRPLVGVVVGLVVLAALSAFAARAEAGGGGARERAARAMREGEFDVAEKLYRELLAKDTRDSDARLGLGHALLKQRKNQDAFDQAARVIASDPTNARAHALLGAALLGAG